MRRAAGRNLNSPFTAQSRTNSHKTPAKQADGAPKRMPPSHVPIRTRTGASTRAPGIRSPPARLPSRRTSLPAPRVAPCSTIPLRPHSATSPEHDRASGGDQQCLPSPGGSSHRTRQHGQADRLRPGRPQDLFVLTAACQAGRQSVGSLGGFCEADQGRWSRRNAPAQPCCGHPRDAKVMTTFNAKNAKAYPFERCD